MDVYVVLLSKLLIKSLYFLHRTIFVIRTQGTIILEKLVTRRNHFDYIILETSGLADPISIIETFWQDSQLNTGFKLDGIITLINVHDFKRNMLDSKCSYLFLKQIGLADRLILNKMDLLENEKELQEIIHDMHSINPVASYYTCTRSQIDLSLILDIQAFDINHLKSIPSFIPEQNSETHIALQQMVIHLNREATINLEDLESWFQYLLWEGMIPYTSHPIEVYRLKGIFLTPDPTYYITIQAVRQTYELLKIPNGSSFFTDSLSNPQLFIIFKGNSGQELETSLNNIILSLDK
jgi:G3E family GTPase